MRDVTIVQTADDLDKVLPGNLEEIAISDITEHINPARTYCDGMYFSLYKISFYSLYNLIFVCDVLNK